MDCDSFVYEVPMIANTSPRVFSLNIWDLISRGTSEYFKELDLCIYCKFYNLIKHALMPSSDKLTGFHIKNPGSNIVNS